MKENHKKTLSFQTINMKLPQLFKTLLQTFRIFFFLEHSPFIELLWFLDICHWFKDTQFIKLYIVHFTLLLSSAQFVNKFFWNTPTNKTHLQQNNIHNDFSTTITVSIYKQQEISSFCNNTLHKDKPECSSTQFWYIYISSYIVFSIHIILTLDMLSMLVELLSIMAWYFLVCNPSRMVIAYFCIFKSSQLHHNLNKNFSMLERNFDWNIFKIVIEVWVSTQSKFDLGLGKVRISIILTINKH